MHLALNGIQHIGLPVSDIRESASFYKELGFENVMESPFMFKEQEGTAIMMKRAAVVLELYQMPGEEGEAVKKRKDGRIDHVAFDVADIDECFSILKTGGFNILEPEPVFLPFWKNGCKYFNITGPDGERLEFNQIL